jgi:MGT family glycosyltransferase
MIAAEASGLPWVKIAYSSLLIPTTGFRLQGPGLPPPVRLRDRLSQYVGALVAAKRADDCYLPMINSVRRENGIEALAHVEDSTRRAPLTLALTAEPFEYPRRDWHPSVRFVGPAIWEPPGDPHAFIERGESAPTPPLILVSSSTLPQTDARLVGTVLEALAEEPVRVIATRPPDWEPSVIPPNARLAVHVPHGSLLPYTTCVVCHAGPGTTQKALAAGVPVVAVPFGRDQFEVARRVEVADAGIRLPPHELTTERLRVAVRDAITKKAGAERVAAAFRAAGGAPAAAGAVEALLAQNATGRAPAHSRKRPSTKHTGSQTPCAIQ